MGSTCKQRERKFIDVGYAYPCGILHHSCVGSASLVLPPSIGTSVANYSNSYFFTIFYFLFIPFRLYFLPTAPPFGSASQASVVTEHCSLKVKCEEAGKCLGTSSLAIEKLFGSCWLKQLCYALLSMFLSRTLGRSASRTRSTVAGLGLHAKWHPAMLAVDSSL